MFRLCIVTERFTIRELLATWFYSYLIFFVSNVNKLRSGRPASVSLIILHYRDAGIEPRLIFPNVFMFFLRQICSESPSS